MADTDKKISELNAAASIDSINDMLPIVQVNTTNRINRDTLLGITSQPVGTTEAQTLTNKTIALGSNTVSGTVAQFNAAVSDGDFATTSSLTAHTGDTSNPHSTTKAQVGLGSVDNTSVASILLQVYPVGAIYMSVSATNPGTAFGGTWVAWGSGRVPVGVDTGQAEFDAVEETGGAKTHTLTEAQLPNITGSWTQHGQENGTMFYTRSGYATGTVISNQYKTIGATAGAQSLQDPGFNFGQGQAHNNLQPYITCYMFKRVS